MEKVLQPCAPGCSASNIKAHVVLTCAISFKSIPNKEQTSELFDAEKPFKFI
jgi:hypothetical protein